MNKFNQTETLTSRIQGSQQRLNRNQALHPTITLDELTMTTRNIPLGTGLLGIAANKPVLFDLFDPAAGSILVVSQHLPVVRKLFTVLMHSLIDHACPSFFQFVVISGYPQKWIDILQKFDPHFKYCAGVIGDCESEVDDWICFLAEKAQERQSGRNPGPAAILFVDDLALILKLNPRAQAQFEWLRKNGSQSRLWVFAGLDFHKDPDLVSEINLFKTRIFSSFPESFKTRLNGNFPDDLIGMPGEERKFITRIGHEWVPFWAPKLQG